MHRSLSHMQVVVLKVTDVILKCQMENDVDVRSSKRHQHERGAQQVIEYSGKSTNSEQRFFFPVLIDFFFSTNES